MEDVVNQPSHYAQDEIECIDVILQQSKYVPSNQAFLMGQVFKYLWRYYLKGKPLEDLQKARWYLNKLIALFEVDHSLGQGRA